MDLRKLLAWIMWAAVTAVLFAGVAVMTDRMGATARFVTWPVVGFTALAALTAIVGAWFGRSRPGLLVAGLLLSLPVSYVLPAAPLSAIAVVVACLGGLAATTRAGVAAGMAAGVGCLMVLLVVLQGPAVECGESSVSSNSGPWWIGSSESTSSGSGWLKPEGAAGGTTQVGDREYEYTCEGGRLTRFRGVG